MPLVVVLALVLVPGLAAASPNVPFVPSATITVNTTSDAAPATGECAPTGSQCSLRQAIDAATSGQSIELPSGTYSITLGQLTVATSVDIVGAGVAATTIDGSGNGSPQSPSRIMKITNSADVAISGITFTGGIDGSDENFKGCSPCETISANGGGAIFSDGSSKLLLTDDAFNGNTGSANPVGGAVASSGTLAMNNVSFDDNSAGFGGGLFVHGGTVAGNAVTFVGNAVDSGGGGGMFVAGGNVTLLNSTFSGNGAANTRGGGLENHAGTVDLYYDSFAGDLRGSIQTDAGHGATTSVGNTIIGSGFSDGVDYGCVSSGQNDGFGEWPYYEYTGPPITTDLGHNIDQDGKCGLSGGTDQIGVDPKLAPIADNGGPVQTEALLAGSPAIDAGDPQACPPLDARNVKRPQGGACDIGAFEAAQPEAAPSATTDPVTNITATDATLHADINLQGLPGAYYFNWGTSPNALTNQTPVSAAGVVSQTTTETEDFPNLSPGQTYYVQAVAANGGAQTVASNVESFTTPAQAPAITDLNNDTPTDTSTTISATIDPNGADTTYTVAWGTDPSNLNQTSAPAVITAASGQQDISQALTGLTPNTTYYYEVDATNSAGSTSSTYPGEQPAQFTTAPQLTGTEGQSVTADDLYSGYDWCPSSDYAQSLPIDWGDGSPAAYGQIVCSSSSDEVQTWTLQASHTYRLAGHYTIGVNGGEGGSQTTYAQIGDAPLTAMPVTASADAGGAFTGTVATFTDGNPQAQAGDFTATIDWGDDSNSTTGTVSAAPGGGFQVSGNHTYNGTGIAPVKVTIDDVSGQEATAASTIQFAQQQPLPPTITNVSASNVTDTTATVSASINPNGSDTSYAIMWGTSPKTLSNTVSGGDIGSGTTAEPETKQITGLPPDTTVYFQVTASNGNTARSPIDSFHTGLQGTEGQPVSSDDLASGFADGCPTASIDWGDASASTSGTVTCNPTNGSYTVSGSHTYRLAGHYTITVTVEGQAKTLAAQIADASLTATPVTASATPGAAFSGTVATFTDGNPQAQAGDFTATIDWGDGSAPTSGTVSAAPGGGFEVSGTHTYASAGRDSVTVTILDDHGGQQAVAHSVVQVANATVETLSVSPVSTITSLAGKVFSGVVATFTDSNPAAVPSDFTASINWGDGTPPTAGTIAAVAGLLRHVAGDPAFQVSGTHTYSSSGAKTITVTVTDAAGQQGSVESPMTVTAPGIGSSAAPTNVTPPAISGKSSEGSTLTATPGSWTGSPTAFEFRWLRCASDGTACTSTGSAGSSYVMRPGDVGHTLEVQVTASNSAGASPATPSATTAVVLPKGLPLPVAGKSADVGVVSGVVLVKLPGHKRFTKLKAYEQIPLGTVINATHGRVTITVRGPGGKLMSADFYRGEFIVRQPRHSRYTQLRLAGGNFAACRAPTHAPLAGIAKRRPKTAKPKGHPVRSLWGSGHGTFQTVGKSASASVQGTIWLTADYCGGTLVHVRRGVVSVRDFVHHKSVKVTAGHSYFT